MNTNDLIKEIQSLPIQKRMYVIEKSIHSIRKEEDANQLRYAAEVLHSEYKTDKNLTAFTVLDFDTFNETR